jgi:uncharacterized protein YdeI (YjbR/CyaY-like superfamily)
VNSNGTDDAREAKSDFMTGSPRSRAVDAYLGRATSWRDEFSTLREIVLGCELTEGLKWGVPCYTHLQRNIALIHGFKEYCAILFFKGALLQDPNGVLVRQTENVQAGRQVRFAGVREIVALENVLKAYLREAVELEKAGLKVDFKPTREFRTPPEFQIKLDESPSLQAAFGALTPGRQRAYLLHFSAAKQSKTRESRIEKNRLRILDGKGLDD